MSAAIQISEVLHYSGVSGSTLNISSITIVQLKNKCNAKAETQDENKMSSEQ